MKQLWKHVNYDAYKHGKGVAILAKERSKPGLSGNCRRGSHSSCYNLLCDCPCHKKEAAG